MHEVGAPPLSGLNVHFVRRTKIHIAISRARLDRGCACGLCVPGSAFARVWAAVTQDEFTAFELKGGHIGRAGNRA